MSIERTLTIFYVEDQMRSAMFYRAVLGSEPVLDVPGITEFQLTDTSKLGVMPEAGIKRLLGEALPDPAAAEGNPRAEIYLLVDDPAAYHARVIANGGREISALARRNWGQDVAYSLDPDGHVLAFACDPKE